MKKQETTALLQASSSGDDAAVAAFSDTVYEELHDLASRLTRRESPPSLQPTALVHEAYLRLVHDSPVSLEDRRHFFAVASTCMRRLLAAHARKRHSLKRGGGFRRVTLLDADPATDESDVDVLALNEALDELANRDARQARVVELRFFGGLSVEDCAAMLGVCPRTVKGDWRFARVWLRARLQEGEKL